MKKIGLLILMVLFIGCLTSCDPLKSFDYYEEGDFIFAYEKYNDGTERLSLYGLSDNGKTKKYLILPSDYKSRKIDTMGVLLSTFYGGTYFKDDFNSSVLEKLFINFELKEVYDKYFYLNNQDDTTKCSFIIWYDFYSGILEYFDYIIKDCIFGYNLLNDDEVMNEVQIYYYPRKCHLV